MAKVMRSLESCLNSKGEAWTVVGGSLYANVHIPVAEILGELAPTCGFETVRVEAFHSIVASRMKVSVPKDVAVDAEVDLGTAGNDYFIQARLSVSLPGMDRQTAQAVVDAAHQACPYSKATRGNIHRFLDMVSSSQVA